MKEQTEALPLTPEQERNEELRHQLARLYVAFVEFWGNDSCVVLLDDVLENVRDIVDDYRTLPVEQACHGPAEVSA